MACPIGPGGHNNRPPGGNTVTMARDVTVTDTYAESHVSHTAREPGAAANKASSGNTAKYGALS